MSTLIVLPFSFSLRFTTQNTALSQNIHKNAAEHGENVAHTQNIHRNAAKRGGNAANTENIHENAAKRGGNAAHTKKVLDCNANPGQISSSRKPHHLRRHIYYLQTIISRIILSVVCMPSAPMRPRLQMVFSMLSSMIPSLDEIQIPSRARTAA